MQLFFIRHCQSENNALWRHTGSDNGRSSDPSLTAIGFQQAQILADFLSVSSAQGRVGKPNGTGNNDFGFTHLYCSLMRRAIQTGTPIAKALGLPLIAHYDIHERGGIYHKDPSTESKQGLPGPNRDDFQTRHPQLILPESLGTEGWWNRPYEEQGEAITRARRFYTWLEERHGGTEDRVAIISHGGFFQSLLSVLLGATLVNTEIEPSREIWIKSNNGAISRFDFWQEAIRLTYLNRVEFFPPELTT